jgi:Tfp pilus assembly protein PilP
MTRTTLKALWVGGGGIVATFLAVSPNNGTPAASTAAALRRPASTSGPTAEELNAQATRLRSRTTEVKLPPSTRNPFRFSSPKPNARPGAAPDAGVQSAVIAPQFPIAPVLPAMKLSGIAQKDGKRTAIISVGDQIYLVGEGDPVGGRFTIVTIDPEAVLLRDATGVEQRLVLPQ